VEEYKMINVLSALCGFIAAVLLALIGIRFTNAQRRKYRILRFLDGKQLHLLFASIVFLALAGTFAVVEKLSDSTSPLVLLVGPAGEQVLGATTTAFEAEISKKATRAAGAAADYFRAGERDYHLGRYRDAALSYKKSLDLVPTMSAYLNLGLSYIQAAQWPYAERALVAGLRIAEEEDNTEYKAAFLTNMGIPYEKQDKLKQALQVQEEALELFKRTDNVQAQAHTIGNIGNLYFHLEAFDEALTHHRRALELHKRVEDLRGEAADLSNIGHVYTATSRPEKAIPYYQDALEQYERVGDVWGEAVTHLGLAKALVSQKRLGNALSHYQSALELARRTEDFELRGVSAYAIAMVHYEANQLQEALKYAKEACTIYEQLYESNSQRVAADYGDALTLVGLIYAMSADLDNALTPLKRAAEIFEQHGMPYRQGHALNNIGMAYEKRDRLNDAYEYYKQAGGAYYRAGNKYMVAYMVANMGVILARADRSEALEMLQTAHNNLVDLGVDPQDELRARIEKAINRLAEDESASRQPKKK
jgi:tetratricopeptide (TPR) repeat protein